MNRYAAFLDAAFDFIDGQEDLPTDENLVDEAYSSFVTALCQCVSFDAVLNSKLCETFFTPDKVNRLLTHTLLRLLCICQSDHNLLETDPSEYQRRTDEEFGLIMMDSLRLTCPHGQNFASECEICQERLYENAMDRKSTVRSATMGMIQSLTGLEGCAEPYLDYVAESLASTPDDNADNISLRCGLLKSFAAAAQHAPTAQNDRIDELVQDVFEHQVLPQLSSTNHEFVVHLKCACAALSERYMSFLFGKGRFDDIVVGILQALIELVADPEETVRMHAFEAFRTTARTHADLSPVLHRHAPDLLTVVCNLFQTTPPDAPCAADILQLVTASVFRFLGRFGDVPDPDTIDAVVRNAGIIESHRVLLELLTSRFHEVADAVSALRQAGDRDEGLEKLLTRHIETIHAVCMSCPTQPSADRERGSMSIHPELIDNLAPVVLELLQPTVVHIAHQNDGIADAIDCISLLPPENEAIQAEVIPALMNVIGENVLGRELCVHPLCLLLHYGGQRTLGGESGEALAKLVEHALTSESPIFLCYIADLVRSIAIISQTADKDDEASDFRQHFTTLLIQQLLRMVDVKASTIPGVQFPVRIISAICTMMYVDPEVTWTCLMAPVSEAGTGLGLLCHYGMVEGFPTLSEKRQTDVKLIFLGLSRVALLEIQNGDFTPDLWRACFEIFRKVKVMESEDDESETHEPFYFDPDDNIMTEEVDELVENEIIFALDAADPVEIFRQATLVACETDDQLREQLMGWAGELWAHLLPSNGMGT